jgi:hypothetical protein
LGPSDSPHTIAIGGGVFFHKGRRSVNTTNGAKSYLGSRSNPGI